MDLEKTKNPDVCEAVPGLPPACDTDICPQDDRLPCVPSCVDIDPVTREVIRSSSCSCLVRPNGCRLDDSLEDPMCLGVCDECEICLTTETKNTNGTLRICCECVKTPGDINLDLVVDLRDFLFLVNCWAADITVKTQCKCADIDRDGTVGTADFLLFLANFGGPQ